MCGNIKRIVTYLAWDLYMWLLVLWEGIIYQYIIEHYIKRNDFKYSSYAMILSSAIIYILFGIGLAYLFKERQGISKKDLILELCLVGIPAMFFLLSSVPFWVGTILRIQMLTLTYMRLAFPLAGIIIGVEIFKIINFVRMKKAVQDEA